MTTYMVWEQFEEENDILPLFTTSNHKIAWEFCRVQNEELGLNIMNQRYKTNHLPPTVTDEEGQSLIAGRACRVTISFDGEVFGWESVNDRSEILKYIEPSPFHQFVCNTETKLKPAIKLVILTQDCLAAQGLALEKLLMARRQEPQAFGDFIEAVKYWIADGAPDGDYTAYWHRIHSLGNG